jgi:hypothetical protein
MFGVFEEAKVKKQVKASFPKIEREEEEEEEKVHKVYDKGD